VAIESKQLALAKTTRAENVARRIARWQNKFIAALSKLPSVKFAAKAAGVSRWKVYHQKKIDADFSERWQGALDHALDDIESRCFEIALGRGGGECNSAEVGLMTWLLRCHRPRPYDPINKTEMAMLGGIIFLPSKVKGKE
jgi:hypothetical protein